MLDEVFVSLRKAQTRLALENRGARDRALEGAAAALDKGRAKILAANGIDVGRARAGGMKESLIDRLLLNDKRIDDMIRGIETVIRLDDPLGRVKAGWTLPNGLLVEQVTVPLGVAAIIYESRPNVTVDAASLAYKAGCSILLRGSSSALESNRVLTALFREGLEAAGGVGGAAAQISPGQS
jgi:glutamate-5-semialdehyde dehydrogenase